MRSTSLLLLALLGLAGPARDGGSRSKLDTPVGDLSCQAAVRYEPASDSDAHAINCIYVSSTAASEAIYTGSFNTERTADLVGDLPTHWIVRSAQDTPNPRASIGQTFSSEGGPAEGRVRILTGQDNESVRLELDPLVGGKQPKWTTAVMILTLVRAQA